MYDFPHFPSGGWLKTARKVVMSRLTQHESELLEFTADDATRISTVNDYPEFFAYLTLVAYETASDEVRKSTSLKEFAKVIAFGLDYGRALSKATSESPFEFPPEFFQAADEMMKRIVEQIDIQEPESNASLLRMDLTIYDAMLLQLVLAAQFKPEKMNDSIALHMIQSVVDSVPKEDS